MIVSTILRHSISCNTHVTVHFQSVEKVKIERYTDIYNPNRADHVLKSVEDKVKCCEGDCNTVDCTVIDQYDGDTLKCPWGSVANGLGVGSGTIFKNSLT